MKIFNILALFFFTAIVAFAQNPNPSPAIDNFIQSQMNQENLPGVSTVIVKNGQVVWIESYGFANIANNIAVEDTTVFLLASISKVFTATATMHAHEEVDININNDVDNYLPWAFNIPDYPTIPVTTKHLLTHTASIYDDTSVTNDYYGYPDPTLSLADCMEGYFSVNGVDYDDYWNFFPNSPGTFYEYSNMGTALLGYVVEAATETLFDAYCNANIFLPLGMNKTAWYYANFDPADVATPYQYTGGNFVAYPQYGFADYPNGQLRSNVVDLSKFMMAYLNGGTLGTNSILSAATINDMWSEQIPSIQAGQGLMWYQEELSYSGGTARLWGHNGGEDGVSTDMYLDPVNEIGICVLTNGEGSAFEICEELYDYALTLTTTSSTDVSVDANCMTVFPNPVDGFFTIQGNLDEYSIQILDASGQIYQTINATDHITVDVNNLPSGLYFISVLNNNNNQIALEKIIKQ